MLVRFISKPHQAVEVLEKSDTLNMHMRFKMFKEIKLAKLRSELFREIPTLKCALTKY